MVSETRVGAATIDITAGDNKLLAQLGDVERGVARSSRKMTDAVKVIGTAVAGVGIALAGIGAASVSAAAEMDRSLSRTRTLVKGMTDNEFAGLRQSVIDFSRATGIATSEVSESLYQTVSAGIAAGDALEFLNDAQTLAKGGFTDLTSASDTLTTILNAYGLEATEAARVSDVLVATQNQGKTTVDEMAAALSNVIPIAASMGVEFEEVGAGLALITASGVPTAEATTQLRSLFVELGKESGKLGKAVREEVGVSFAEFQSRGGDVGDLLVRLSADMPTADFNALFSSVEARSAALIIGANRGQGFADALTATAHSAGAATTAAGIMDATFSEKLNRTLNYLQTSLIELGTKLLPHVEAGFEVIAPIAQNLATHGIKMLKDAFDLLGPPVRTMVETLLPVLSELFRTLRPIVRDFAGVALQLLGETFRWISQTVVPALVEVWEDSLRPAVEWLGRWWADNREPIVQAITIVAGGLRNLATLVIEVLGPAFEYVIMPILRVFVTVLGEVIGVIARVIVAASKWREAWNTALGFIRETFGSVAGFIIDKIVGLVEGLQSIVNKIPGVNIDITSGLTEMRDTFQAGLAESNAEIDTATETMETTVATVMDEIDSTVDASIGEGGAVVQSIETGMADAKVKTEEGMTEIKDVIDRDWDAIIAMWDEKAEDHLAQIDEHNRAISDDLNASLERQFIAVEQFQQDVIDADKRAYNTRADEWMAAKKREADARAQAHIEEVESETAHQETLTAAQTTAQTAELTTLTEHFARRAEIRATAQTAEIESWQAHHTSMANATMMALEGLSAADSAMRQAALDAVKVLTGEKRMEEDMSSYSSGTTARGSTRRQRGGVTKTKTGNVVYVEGVGRVNIGSYESFGAASKAVGGTHTLPTSGPPGGFAPPGSSIVGPDLDKLRKSIPKAHTGGLVMVGERGAEVVQIPDGSYIHNAEDTDRMMRGGDNITVIVRGDFIGDRRGVDKLMKQIEEGRRRNFPAVRRPGI